MSTLLSSKYGENDRRFTPCQQHEASKDAPVEDFLISRVLRDPTTGEILGHKFEAPQDFIPAEAFSSFSDLDVASFPLAMDLVTNKLVQLGLEDVYSTRGLSFAEDTGMMTLHRTKSGGCVLDANSHHDRRDAWARVSDGWIRLGCFCDSSRTICLGNVKGSQASLEELCLREISYELKHPNTVRINTPVVGEYTTYFNDADILLVASNMMTQKTDGEVKYIQSLKTSVYSPRFSLINFRKTLGEKMLLDLKEAGIPARMYSDCIGRDGRIDEAYLLVQIDSLTKVSRLSRFRGPR